MPSEKAKTNAEPNEHVLTFVRRSKVGGKGKEENYKLFAAFLPLIDELFLFSSSPSLQLPNAIFFAFSFFFPLHLGTDALPPTHLLDFLPLQPIATIRNAKSVAERRK